MAIQVLKIEDAGFDMDAGCCVQNVVVQDEATGMTVKVERCVWNGDEDGDGLEGWFAEAVQFAQAGYEGYSLA